MVTPEWFGDASDALTGALPASSTTQRSTTLTRAGRHAPVVAQPGERGQSRLDEQGLIALGHAVEQRCSDFFDPIVLAQLDAALAHQLAHSARARAQAAAAALDLAVCEGRATEALDHVAHHAAAARSAARQAGSRATQATEVVSSLGGQVTGQGFDAAVVAQVSPGGLIEALAVLETAKNALAAVQAQVQTLFVAQQRLSQAQAGFEQAKLGQGIAQQVGLARHESPHRGRHLCSLSEVLVRELPATMRAFTKGLLSEYRAGLIAKETAFLSWTDRLAVDKLMCGEPSALAGLGNRELATATKKAAYALDPEAFVQRYEKAVGERYVSLRPAADGMTFLTALIPLKEGVRILATLTQVVGRAKAAGDQRGKGQLLADVLMHRLIQHAPCDEGAGGPGDHRGPAVPGLPAPGPAGDGGAHQSTGESLCTSVMDAVIAVELVMTDRSLFGGASDPALLVGYDPVPAPIARRMVLGADPVTGQQRPSQVWLKRLFTHPDSNALLSMDSRARLFPEGMKEFLRLQGQRCQTPYCDAPITEYDHIKAFAAGGATTLSNGQGLCTACNQAKETAGWSSAARVGAGVGLPRIETTTPTGHRYVSTAPPLPGPARGRSQRTRPWRC